MRRRRMTINEPTRVNLLGNSIVLIAPKDSAIDNVKIGPGFDLAKLAGDGRITTGDVKAVPAGKYAKAALEKLGSWQAAEPKFAMAENVRAALTLVARGEAVLGIVYSTDAKVEPGVKIVGTFPADSHPAIIYPVAATSHRETGDARTISPSCVRPRRRPSSKNTASSSWSALRPDVRDLAGRMDGHPAFAARRRHCDAGGNAVRHRAGVAAGAAELLGQIRSLTRRCICRWCCRRSSPAICCC